MNVSPPSLPKAGRVLQHECDSMRWIFDDSYYHNAYDYIFRQRATPKS